MINHSNFCWDCCFMYFKTSEINIAVAKTKIDCTTCTVQNKATANNKCPCYLWQVTYRSRLCTVTKTLIDILEKNSFLSYSMCFSFLFTSKTFYEGLFEDYKWINCPVSVYIYVLQTTFSFICYDFTWHSMVIFYTSIYHVT